MFIINKKSIVVLLVLTLALAAYAQFQGTLTQQSPQRLDVTQNYFTSNTASATITITPPANQYVYITQIEIEDCAGAAVTGAVPVSVTSTGLGGGTTPVFMVGTTSTAGICNPASGYFGGIPLKSNTPGASVTFVLPAFATNQIVRVNVWAYYAP